MTENPEGWFKKWCIWCLSRIFPVEVLSPSTAGHDRATKLPIYAEARVPEVWFIDPQAKTVEVLSLHGAKYIVEATYAGHHVLTSNLFTGWQLPLDDLFDFRGRF